MKITKVINHGQTRYRVNDPTGEGGKRARKFFETREAAEAYVKERMQDTKAFGVHFASIPTEQRAEIAFQIQRLKNLGWTLADAVDCIERQGKPAPAMPLAKLATEFMQAKETSNLRPRYVKTLRASINRFLLGRREKLISQITPSEIQEYISSNGWKPATARSYLIDVRTLFSFAVKRKYIPDNPAMAVDLPKTEETPPGIVTPKQARAILDATIDHAPDILPPVALMLFGGLRRSEAEQLAWDEVGEEHVEVKAHKAKTRQRRLVPISPQLHAWLETSRKVGGKLPAVNYADKLKLVLDEAGLRKEWPQNALRHSFASYYFAQTKNENETAARMGNSPQMVFQHYRELVRPADAEAFFAILPPGDAEERADKAREAHPRLMPQRDGKITSAAMAAVFQRNRHSMTRKEAVEALRSQTGCSVPAAYAALSLDGRFGARLAEDGGRLSWLTYAAAERQPTPKSEPLETLYT